MVRLSILSVAAALALGGCAAPNQQGGGFAAVLDDVFGSMALGRAIQTPQAPPAAPPRPVNCTSTTAGGVVSTSCY